VLAGLVSTAYVVICRRELVQVAFQRHAFGAGDAGRTATLVAILAAALTGASLTANGARTLFALGRRREVLVISAGALALYVVAAVVLREAYGLNGLATAFSVASTVGGLVLAAVLARTLGIGLRRVIREWVVAPVLLASAFAVGALAVWLPFGGPHRSFGAALATALAVALAGLATLLIGILFTDGVEHALLRRLIARAPAPFDRRRRPT
jgi:peptidoglycan biosynthesis protein MviN/MurJ (putative lipid II flippase)